MMVIISFEFTYILALLKSFFKLHSCFFIPLVLGQEVHILDIDNSAILQLLFNDR